MLGKEFNADSLKDCFDVTDNIITLIKERYKGVPDTLSRFLRNDEYNSLRKTVNRVVSDQLPGIVEKVRKELGI